MEINNIDAKGLKELLKNRENLELIDVRDKDEYDLVHIKGSKLMSMRDIVKRSEEIDWSKEVVFICRSGERSMMVANFLADSGKRISNLFGGILEYWKSGELDLEFLEGKDVEKYF